MFNRLYAWAVSKETMNQGPIKNQDEPKQDIHRGTTRPSLDPGQALRLLVGLCYQAEMRLLRDKSRILFVAITVQRLCGNEVPADGASLQALCVADRNWTTEQVRNLLDEIVSAGLARTYTRADREYVELSERIWQRGQELNSSDLPSSSKLVSNLLTNRDVNDVKETTTKEGPGIHTDYYEDFLIPRDSVLRRLPIGAFEKEIAQCSEAGEDYVPIMLQAVTAFYAVEISGKRIDRPGSYLGGIVRKMLKEKASEQADAEEGKVPERKDGLCSHCKERAVVPNLEGVCSECWKELHATVSDATRAQMDKLRERLTMDNTRGTAPEHDDTSAKKADAMAKLDDLAKRG